MKLKTPAFLPFSPAITVFGLLLVAAGCSGGGGGGNGVGESKVVAGEVQAALEGIGLKTLRTDSAEISSPAIIIGGQSGSDELANDFDTLFKCREKSADGVFKLEARTADGSGLEPPADTVRRLQEALNILEQNGIQHGTVVGHNTGGLVARKALEGGQSSNRTGLIASAIQIRLMTFAAPFNGVPEDVMRAAYPLEFQEGSEFIKSQGPLASNVEHFKYDVGLPRVNTLITADQPDGLFITSQVRFFKSQFNTKVDNDPQIRVNLRQDFSNLPFVLPRRMNEAMDSAGFAPTTCLQAEEPSDSIDIQGAGAAVEVARTKSAAAATKELTAFSQRDLALFGLVNANGAFDPHLPTVILVHGDNGDAANYDNLEDSFEAGNYNVFRFVYQQSSNPNQQVVDQIVQFEAAHPSMESITDGFVEAVKKLKELTGQSQITVVAHSMGGLIVRRGLTSERGNTLAGIPDLVITFVSVATPFGGAGALSGAPGYISTIFLTIGSFFPGNDYYRALVDDEFLGGSLGSNVFFYKIESSEDGTGQEVISVEGQRRDNVDNDPQRIFLVDLPNLPISAGHVQIIQGTDFVPVIFNLTQLTQTQVNQLISTAGVATTVVTTSISTTVRTTTTTRHHASSSSSIHSTSIPTSSVSTLTTTTTTSVPADQFGCLDGAYESLTNNCEITAFSLTETPGSLHVNPFGTNGAQNFTIVSPENASQSGLTIFGQPNHTCTIVCSDSGQGLISLHCEDSDSHCDQTMAGPGTFNN